MPTSVSKLGSFWWVLSRRLVSLPFLALGTLATQTFVLTLPILAPAGDDGQESISAVAGVALLLLGLGFFLWGRKYIKLAGGGVMFLVGAILALATIYMLLMMAGYPGEDMLLDNGPREQRITVSFGISALFFLTGGVTLFVSGIRRLTFEVPSVQGTSEFTQ